MKQLFDNLDSAIHQRNSINRDEFFETVSYQVKHRTKFLGFNGEPYYTTEYKRIFSEDRYNATIRNADEQINNCRTAINNCINDTKQQLNTIISTNISATSEINALKNDISSTRSQLAKYNNLSSAIRDQTNKINSINSEINQTKQYSTNINNQVHQAKQQNKQEQLKITVNNKSLLDLKTKLDDIPKQHYDTIAGLDKQQRALIFSKMYNNPDTPDINSVIQLIQVFGFDAEYLASIALETNNEELFNIALESHADCISRSLDGKTILQLAILHERESFIKKIMNENESFECTLLNALKENDILTIQTIANIRPDVLHQLIEGYSILQIAISCNNEEAINTILSLDSSVINIHNSNDESAFLIALRSGTPEVIYKMAKLVDLEQECQHLIDNNHIDLFDKVLEIDLLSIASLTNMLFNVLNSNDIELASKIITSKPDIIDHLPEQGKNILTNVALIDSEIANVIGYQDITYNIHDDIAGESIDLNFTDNL